MLAQSQTHMPSPTLHALRYVLLTPLPPSTVSVSDTSQFLLLLGYEGPSAFANTPHSFPSATQVGTQLTRLWPKKKTLKFYERCWMKTSQKSTSTHAPKLPLPSSQICHSQRSPAMSHTAVEASQFGQENRQAKKKKNVVKPQGKNVNIRNQFTHAGWGNRYSQLSKTPLGTPARPPLHTHTHSPGLRSVFAHSFSTQITPCPGEVPPGYLPPSLNITKMP